MDLLTWEEAAAWEVEILANTKQFTDLKPKGLKLTYPKLSNLYEEIKKNYKKNLSQNELQFLVPDRKRGYSDSSYDGDMIND